MRLLTGDQVSHILRELSRQDAQTLLDALSTAMANYTAQQTSPSKDQSIHQPLRTVIVTAQKDTTLVMPVSDSSTTAVKVATVPAKGAIQGAITIYSAVGELLGVLNAAEITAFRTALATMTMLTRWAQSSGNAEKREMVVFGAGKQAEWHVRLALLLVDGVERVTVINRAAERLESFQQATIDPLRTSHPHIRFDCLAASAEGYQSQMASRLSTASIVCCCTPSREPLFSMQQLMSEHHGAKFLSLIGSYKPEMQEVDSETIKLAERVWVDSKSACLEEAGELIRAKLTEEDLTEAGELFVEQANVKLDPTVKLTIFKCVGLAIMDLTIARALLDTAADKKIGTTLDSF